MNISSVSSSQSVSYTSQDSSSEIAKLEKQKQALEKELQSVSQGKEDAQTKQEKVKQLQLQIQQVEAQIQQLKADKNKTQSSQQNSPAENISKGEDALKSESQSKLIKSMTSTSIDVQI